MSKIQEDVAKAMLEQIANLCEHFFTTGYEAGAGEEISEPARDAAKKVIEEHLLKQWGEFNDD